MLRYWKQRWLSKKWLWVLLGSTLKTIQVAICPITFAIPRERVGVTVCHGNCLKWVASAELNSFGRLVQLGRAYRLDGTLQNEVEQCVDICSLHKLSKRILASSALALWMFLRFFDDRITVPHSAITKNQLIRFLQCERIKEKMQDEGMLCGQVRHRIFKLPTFFLM